MARVLDVLLNQRLVGQLEQDDSGSLWFRYVEDWLASPDAVPLSHSLPLRKEPFKRNECRPFFAGLLPEEQSRDVIAKVLGVSSRNDFAILERIGGECAGAVMLVPPGTALSSIAGSYRELTKPELAGLIAQLPQRPLLAGQAGVRLSLAGAQGKLALAVDPNGVYRLPLDGAPSTHILKPESTRFEQLVENECFCMRLAELAGLDVAKVDIDDAEGRKFLLIERYDRIPAQEGFSERIHQEDFCQALGIPPELKYQQEGGPNLKQCFELVRMVSSVPGVDVLRLFNAVIFNFLIGNNDAHGKNFSFLYRDGTARLAPLYDLVSTQAYPTLSADMAMKIGKERNPMALTAKHWGRLFEDAGLNPTIAVRHLQATTRKVLNLIPKVDVAHKTLPSLVQANCDRLLAIKWVDGGSS